MTPLDAIILALATYRLAFMLVHEDAPLGLARHIRNLLGASETACTAQHAAHRITNALCCIDCTSVYAAAVVLALWLVFQPVVWVLALSAAAMLLHERG